MDIQHVARRLEELPICANSYGNVGCTAAGWPVDKVKVCKAMALPLGKLQLPDILFGWEAAKWLMDIAKQILGRSVCVYRAAFEQIAFKTYSICSVERILEFQKTGATWSVVLEPSKVITKRPLKSKSGASAWISY